jgi:hypothetical protein
LQRAQLRRSEQDIRDAGRGGKADRAIRFPDEGIAVRQPEAHAAQRLPYQGVAVDHPGSGIDGYSPVALAGHDRGGDGGRKLYMLDTGRKPVRQERRDQNRCGK